MTDDAGDDASDGVWMTYGQLSMARTITRRAAVRLSQRHGWRRTQGNDGLARILVPQEWLKPADRARDVAGDDAPPRASDDAGNVANVVATAIAPLVVRAERAEAEADRMRVERDRERDRGDVATARAEKAEAGRETAEARADALRGELETLRGQITARQDTERVRADALRDRVDDLGAKLGDAQAELAAAQDAAERAGTQAEAAQHGEREAKRALEAAGAGGRWARLRRAWRGEGAG